VAQIVRLAGRALHPGPVLVERDRGAPPCLPKLLQRRDVLLEACERIEQAAVGRRVDQRALVMWP